jgi:hypothetical protein
MRIDKTFALLAVVAGMALAGASSVKAQDRYWDTRRDARIERLQNDIARDRWRLDNDIRRGKGRAASHVARDLAKDQRKLDRQLRRR